MSTRAAPSPIAQGKPAQRYRIGIIGAGWIVKTSHLPAYRDAHFEAVRIASRTAESAAALASEFGIPSASGRWEDVIEDDRVEVVDIALPPHRNREVCEAAFAAGKHVLVQKPLAPTLEEAAAIVRAARRTGRVLAVNHNGRWDPAIRALRGLIDAGVMGRLMSASWTSHLPGPWQDFWFDATNYAPRLIMLNLSVHFLDQFRYLFGEPTSMTAVTTSLRGDRRGADGIAGYHAVYASGFLASGLDDGFSWVDDWRTMFRVEGESVIARGAMGLTPELRSTLEVVTRDQPSRWNAIPLTGRWFPEAFAATMGELFRAIDQGDEPSISGRDHLLTLRLVEAAYRSAAEGRSVNVAEIPVAAEA